MTKSLPDMTVEELRVEEARIGSCLYRAEDLFSQMLLSGRLNAITRLIQEKSGP